MIPSLRDLCAIVVAAEIDRAPYYYISVLADVPTEYLKPIFKKLCYIPLEVMFSQSLPNKLEISSIETLRR